MPSDQARERLAAALRELRTGAGLSTPQLAERLGWSQSRVSRLERGVTLADPEDVAAWGSATGAEPQVIADLAWRSERVVNAARPWKAVHAGGLVVRQREIAALEREMTAHYEFAPDVVPGLLQTRPYAARVLELADPSGQRDIAGAVAARINRQGVLLDPGKHFEFIITEWALRYRIGDPDVMGGQADKILSVMSLPNVAVYVMPIDPGPDAPLPSALTQSGFTIKDVPGEPVVVVELLTHELTPSAAAEVAAYRDAFTRLRESSVTDAEAASIIRHSL